MALAGALDAGDPGAGGNSFKVPKKEGFHGGVDGSPSAGSSNKLY